MGRFVRVVLSLLLLLAAAPATADDPISTESVGAGPPDPFVQWPQPSEVPTLEYAVGWVRAMEAEGRPRQETAQWLAGVLDKRITNLNSPERMTLGENWIPFGAGEYLWETSDQRFQAWRDQGNFDYADTAAWAWENQLGQCSEHANTAYYILREAGVAGNVRIFTAPGHEFAVWGIADGADPDDPSTWGPDAFIVDGWLGRAIQPSEAATSRYFKGSDGTGVIVESTTSFDNEASAWVVSGGAATDLGDCFVATAAWGTPLAAQVQVLREFRDHRLRRSRAGRAAVSWYGVLGPPAAKWIRPRPRARALAREGLEPVVWGVEATRDRWDGADR
jgi:hypothetical protein